MENKEAIDLTLIIPTLNEAKNLPFILNRIPKIVDEIIIVDGNSTDDTIKIVKKYLDKPRILFQNGKGKGNAVRYGFKMSRGKYICMLDADGSMNPKEIPRFLSALKKGFDYVKGSRMTKGGKTGDMTAFRVVGNKLFVILINLLYFTHFTDLCYGFVAFKREILESVDLRADGFHIETEMLLKVLKKKYRIKEVPSCEKKRLHGQSKLNAFFDGYKILFTIFKERLLK